MFSARQVSALSDERRAFTLSAEDIRLINPNTRTCPVFRSSADAELTKRIYARVPVLIDEAKGPAGNPWGISFSRLFDMSNDSGLFRTARQLEADGAVRAGADWVLPDGAHMAPLYEAKMIHHFDHRWATYAADGETSRDFTAAEKADPRAIASPRYWVPHEEVQSRLPARPKALAEAYARRSAKLCIEVIELWLCGRMLAEGCKEVAEQQLDRIGLRRNAGPGSVRAALADRLGIERLAHRLFAESPVTAEDRAIIVDNLVDNPVETARLLLDRRRPRWLMGWRDITNATNERTVIAAAMPVMGIGHTLPLMFVEGDPFKQMCLVASWSSLVMDFLARQKVGGTHLTYGYLKQIPTLPPGSFTGSVTGFLQPRILELTFTAVDMRPWANDLGYDGPPFAWNENRRALLRADLDAAYAHLYGLPRDELRYILDPADIHGPAFPSETFRVLKDKETRQHGEYRTSRLVLAAWDRLTSEGTIESWGEPV